MQPFVMLGGVFRAVSVGPVGIEFDDTKSVGNGVKATFVLYETDV
jgi:hypothetical protein